MLKRARVALVLAALGIAVVACSAGSINGGTAVPEQQAQVTSASGVVITATISASTLGDECATGGSVAAGSFAGDCAGTPPSSNVDGGGGTSSKPAPGGCGGSFCQQSNVQIAFTAGAGTQPATVEIVSVTLVDTSGKLVDTLTASKPQAWDGNGYVAWNQTIKPSGDLKASYDLTAPAWSKIDGSGSGARVTSYSTKYRLQVSLRIDGVAVVLESTELNREPAVAT